MHAMWSQVSVFCFFIMLFLLLFIYHHHHKDKLNSQIIIKICIQALVFVVPNVYMKKVRVSLALREHHLALATRFQATARFDTWQARHTT